MVLRRNALIFSGMAFLAFMLIGIALIIGAVSNWKIELLLILAVAVGAAGGQFIGLAAQVMAPDPPNPHAAELDHQYRMAQLDLAAEQHSMVDQAVG